MIEVEAPDGTIVEFPDDTPRDVMQAAMAKRFGGPAAQPGMAQSVLRAAALPMKGLQESVLETIGGVPDLVAKGLQAIGVPGQRPGMYTQALKSWLMPGAERIAPQSGAEKLLYGAGHGVGDAVSLLLPAAGVARAAQAGGLAQRSAAALASNPGMQAAAGAAGGAVGEATDSPLLGLGAAMAVPGLAATGSAAKAGYRMLNPSVQPEAIDRTIARTFDPVDITDARRRLKEMTAAGEPTALFQLGGESTRRLARAAAGMPGESADISQAAITSMREGMGERVLKDVSRAFKGDDFLESEQKLIDTLRANASEAYGAFRKKVPYVWSDKLAELFQTRPSLRDAIGIAMRNAAEDEGRAFGIVRASDGKFMSAKGFRRGEPIQALTAEAVDDVKKALDTILSSKSSINEQTGRLNNYGRLVAKTKEQFLQAVEEADKTGLYKAARQQYAGDAEVLDALRKGREFAKMDPREIEQFMKTASFAEQDAFRTGMQDAIERSVKEIRGDKTKALFRKNDWTDEQLRAALPPRDYRLLKRRIDARKQGWEDTGFVSSRTGSQTELRQADAASLGEDALKALGKMAVGQRPSVAAFDAFQQWLGRRQQGVARQTAPALTRRLFETDPGELERFLEWVARNRPKAPPGGLPGATGGMTAGIIGAREKGPALEWLLTP